MKDQELTVIDNLINNTTGMPSIEYLAKAADKSEKLAISEHSYESNDTCHNASSTNFPEPQIEEVHWHKGLKQRFFTLSSLSLHAHREMY